MAESLPIDEAEAVVLVTPTQMHASQGIACLEAGKHVQVEIPLADSLADAEAVVVTQEQTGLVAMVGHTRRFNPSHASVARREHLGDQQLAVGLGRMDTADVPPTLRRWWPAGGVSLC